MSSRQTPARERREVFTPGQIVRRAAWFLTMLLCALRASDVIDWAWYAVMSPALAVIAGWVIYLLLAGCIVVATDYDGVSHRR